MTKSSKYNNEHKRLIGILDEVIQELDLRLSTKLVSSYSIHNEKKSDMIVPIQNSYSSKNTKSLESDHLSIIELIAQDKEFILNLALQTNNTNSLRSELEDEISNVFKKLCKLVTKHIKLNELTEYGTQYNSIVNAMTEVKDIVIDIFSHSLPVAQDRALVARLPCGLGFFDRDHQDELKEEFKLAKDLAIASRMEKRRQYINANQSYEADVLLKEAAEIKKFIVKS